MFHLSCVEAKSLAGHRYPDTIQWTKATNFLVSPLKLNWEPGRNERVKRMERPQVTFDRNGNPFALIVAISDDEPVTYNVRIPLSDQTTAKH